jgi:hypothetical protein
MRKERGNMMPRNMGVIEEFIDSEDILQHDHHLPSNLKQTIKPFGIHV